MKTITKLIIGLLAALILMGCEKDYDKEMLTLSVEEKLDKAGVTAQERRAMTNFVSICYPRAYENVSNVPEELGAKSTLKQERELTYKYLVDACKNDRASLVNGVENIRKQSSLKKYAVDTAIFEVIGELEYEMMNGEYWDY